MRPDHAMGMLLFAMSVMRARFSATAVFLNGAGGGHALQLAEPAAHVLGGHQQRPQQLVGVCAHDQCRHRVWVRSPTAAIIREAPMSNAHMTLHAFQSQAPHAIPPCCCVQNLVLAIGQTKPHQKNPSNNRISYCNMGVSWGL